MERIFMEKIISYCGLECTACPAFITTAADDDAARKRIAVEWSKQYNTTLRPDDIYCNGCLNDEGRIFGHCAVCELRKCGRERKVANCAGCADYACSKLEEFFAVAPQARNTLEALRKR